MPIFRILLNTLKVKYGITGTALHWYSSYLADRSFSIVINGITSDSFPICCGVPQGSCLGPLLFTKYASSFFDVVYKHLPSVHGYADDQQLYISFTSNDNKGQRSAVLTMEHCLRDVKDWMFSQKLKMNDSKTEVILFATKQQLAKVNFDSIKVCESDIKIVDCVKNLAWLSL